VDLTREHLIMLALGLGLLVVLLIAFWRKKGPKDAEILDPRERLRFALGKTRGGFADAIRRTLSSTIDEQVLSSLEEILLETDLGVNATEQLLEDLKEGFRKGEVQSQDQVLELLQRQIRKRLDEHPTALAKAASPPTVILVCGVNGCGKTTSIAKLTHYLAEQGNKVLLCASDTFRAAAVEQLRTWADRLGVEIVLGQQGHDPAAVAFSAHEKAVAKKFDYLIIDTAGRLHTDKNLMKELEKIARVGKKHIAESPHEVLLVLDATTGQNAVRQAAAFTECVDVTGIILAKLDGSAKGGIVVVIREKLGIPVKFVGLGEQPTDLALFDADKFVEALLV
jgi:fused signal recognition particle receptor